MTDRLTIPRAAFNQMLAIRDTGATNMFDSGNVRHMATAFDEPHLIEWLDEHGDGALGPLIMGNVEVADE